MNKWIIKYFGINKFNFFGWLFAGVLGVGATLFTLHFVVEMVRARNFEAANTLLLLGIVLLLALQVGITFQIYTSKLAEKLSSENKEKESSNK